MNTPHPVTDRVECHLARTALHRQVGTPQTYRATIVAANHVLSCTTAIQTIRQVAQRVKARAAGGLGADDAHLVLLVSQERLDRALAGMSARSCQRVYDDLAAIQTLGQAQLVSCVLHRPAVSAGLVQHSLGQGDVWIGEGPEGLQLVEARPLGEDELLVLLVQQDS